MIWALLPVKDLVRAKTRLSGVLAPHERRRLVQAMLEDVLCALGQVEQLAGVLLVSDDPTVDLLAHKYPIEVMTEQFLGCRGLNAAVESATALLAGRGATDVMVIHGDLPLVQPADLEAALAAYREPGVDMLVAPDLGGRGTNLMLYPSATPPAFSYGPDSCAAHLADAAARGLSARVLRDSRLGLDVDDPGDLLHLHHALQAGQRGEHCAALLLGYGVSQRLAVMERAGLVPEWDGGGRLSDREALALAGVEDTARLMAEAAALRDRGHHSVVSYSRKVFIPLTHLCRDVCHYCTFARTPKRIPQPYMPVDEVLSLCREGERMGCKEALFTLGERPELRYSAARDALAEMGFASTLEYLAFVAGRVLEETDLLPHINAGCMDDREFAMLRPVSASMGIMLESASPRLCERGMPHHGSPDKEPRRRLDTIERAGRHGVAFTSGILIGIGETRRERVESLLALRTAHELHGHLQEIIIQNFRAKRGTLMADAPEPDLDELLWTVAVARLVFGPDMNIQAPPNLSPGALPQLVSAGINDWGGVSPLTPDHVNPEAPWPHLDKLAAETARAGKHLHERLTLYPAFARDPQRWLHPDRVADMLRRVDAAGFPRTDDWCPGGDMAPPEAPAIHPAVSGERAPADLVDIVNRCRHSESLSGEDVERLFNARGPELSFVVEQADALRREVCGDAVSFVVNRNINYTNICYFKCQFCAFSKGKLSENLRGRPYDLSADEIARRCEEAWSRGATEVCMQGGIHPEYTGQTYVDILSTVKSATPDIHVHAFSPLEVWQGASTLGLELDAYLRQLKAAGLDTLPGTAAEVLHDEVRAELCPDKIDTAQWLQVMEAAHRVGFSTTATIMYGHIDSPRHWAAHLLAIRDLQARTGGFTEFVPLAFVHMEAPMYLKGRARCGPTFREALLMHAVGRLVLHGFIDNVQTSWVKMGREGVAACLNAGANDLGGTLMNETITRAAGAGHGQEWPPARMEAVIRALGRQPRQRNTVYGEVGEERLRAGRDAPQLLPVSNTPARRYERGKGAVEPAQEAGGLSHV